MSKKFFVFAAFVIVVSFALLTRVSDTNAQGPTGGKRNVPSAQLGTGFTYQGQLKKSGSPVSDTCNFQFSLWDSQGSGSPPTGGTQIGTQTVNGVNVTNGLFTVQLNAANQFGVTAFRGDDRWLQAAVQCAGDGSPITLTRQQLTAAPYALGLMPGASIIGQSSTGLYAESTAVSGTGLRGVANNTGGIGVYGKSNGPFGSGVFGESSGGSDSAGVYAVGLGNSAALQIGGAIKVTNAGVGSSTPVFIHQAAGGSSITCIDNPFLNGNADAILIVTPRAYWNGATIVYPNPVGVYYDVTNLFACSARWLIYTLDGANINASARFDVMVIKP